MFNIDNSFSRHLPQDNNHGGEPRQVQAAFAFVEPTPVRKPQLIAFSTEVASLLDLDVSEFSANETAEIFAGNRIMNNMHPYAMNYGGHQFGHWAGQLGDGRAITLCEIINRFNERWEIQLKGAGKTPFSRSGDGRAVLRSSIREFLCSEAVHHLGIPSTRALSLVETGELIVRDMFYNGNPKEEPGAIVCRVAPNFLRFGNYELPSSRGDNKLLQQLVNYTIEHHFPHLLSENLPASEEIYGNWFMEICEKTAFLVSEWMRVGFVHGVLNTDNMSVMGLTIDYGPYGWIDNFDRKWTPNTTDADGLRYCFGNQPAIAHWNLYQLARAVRILFQSDKPLQNGLDHFEKTYKANEKRVISNKLGLSQGTEEDFLLMNDLYDLLELCEIDMTIFFTALNRLDINSPNLSVFDEAFYSDEKKQRNITAVTNWSDRYVARVLNDSISKEKRNQLMNRNNPKFILRNYLVQQAIESAEKGDFAGITKLMEIIRCPYEQHIDQHFLARRPEWARKKPGCSMLSCSS